MKVTAIKTVVVNAQMRNWIFIKVETNEPGLYFASFLKNRRATSSSLISAISVSVRSRPYADANGSALATYPYLKYTPQK